jgi:hypothetical protein
MFKLQYNLLINTTTFNIALQQQSVTSASNSDLQLTLEGTFTIVLLVALLYNYSSKLGIQSV